MNVNIGGKTKILIAERVKFSIGVLLPEHTPIDVTVEENINCGVTAHVDMYLFGKKKSFSHVTELPTVKGIVKVPNKWYDAFKEAYFPKWLLKEFPCKYREIITYTKHVTEHHVTKICPHLSSDNEFKHMHWISNPDNTPGTAGLPSYKKCPKCGFNMTSTDDPKTEHVVYICERCMHFERAHK